MFKIEDFKVGDKVILKADGSVYDDLWVDERIKGELVEVVNVFGDTLEVELPSTELRQTIFLTHILRKVDNMQELKECMIVRCISHDLSWYDYGKMYDVGYDPYQDFGVLDDDGDVMEAGCFKATSAGDYFEGFSWDNFELVSEPEDEDVHLRNVTTFAELLKYLEGFRDAGGDMETKIEYLIVKENK